MLRGDNVIAGTSTTGTGTLTLSAVPQPPGGLDFDTWARALGFGNSAALPVSYTIIEYADTTFSKAVGTEKGVGTLTLGASAGIANCTLARTTSQVSVTGMNGSSPSVSIGSAYSIGTAANALVFIAPSSAELASPSPYFSTSGVDANWGVSPEWHLYSSGSAASFNTTNYDYYVPFRWPVAMLVKRVSVRVATYTSPTGSPAIYARIYAVGSDGRPGKLLFDFTPSSPIVPTSTGNFSAAPGGSFLLLPGDYYMDFALTGLTGGTLAMSGANPVYEAANTAAWRVGTKNGNIAAYAICLSPTAGAGPDPANLTTWNPEISVSTIPFTFGLNNA